MKRYILFAGCNGVGKSTLYQTNDMFREMPRVNMDEIVREFGSWKNEADAFKAGKIAVRKISENFSNGLSFNQSKSQRREFVQGFQKVATAFLMLMLNVDL